MASEASAGSCRRRLGASRIRLAKKLIEQLLEQLKEENVRLEAEYRQLQETGQSRNSRSVEEKTLTQQRTRLEARMAILEDHNRQLEAQLERLRHLVHGENGVTSASAGLQTKYIVAADLHREDFRQPDPGHERPRPPQLSVPGRAVSDRSSGSFRDSGTSDGEQRLSCTSGSLNLSQHQTETVQVHTSKNKSYIVVVSIVIPIIILT